MSRLYRQGDVLFKEVDELPTNKRKLDTDIIVRGEATIRSFFFVLLSSLLYEIL